jgi:hypothetical protein
MRGRAVLLLLGITALAAYSMGSHNAPVSEPQPVAVMNSPPVLAKPVAFSRPAAQTPAPIPSPTSLAKTDPSDKSARTDNKGKVEAALTAAAIAAIIVQASRDQYHAGGRPCACLDETARNGSSCGGRSAYSRPGGAAPLCYPSDVTVTM